MGYPKLLPLDEDDRELLRRLVTRYRAYLRPHEWRLVERSVSLSAWSGLLKARLTSLYERAVDRALLDAERPTWSATTASWQTAVADLALSTRARYVLERNRLTTLADLVQATEDRLSALRGGSTETIREIAEVLTVFGFAETAWHRFRGKPLARRATVPRRLTE